MDGGPVLLKASCPFYVGTLEWIEFGTFWVMEVGPYYSKARDQSTSGSLDFLGSL